VPLHHPSASVGEEMVAVCRRQEAAIDCRQTRRDQAPVSRCAGLVVYRYKRPFRDGSTQVVLEPLDFMFRMNGMRRAQGCARAAMARLASLVPGPRLNLDQKTRGVQDSYSATLSALPKPFTQRSVTRSRGENYKNPLILQGKLNFLPPPYWVFLSC
jgi:hypothetical protein